MIRPLYKNQPKPKKNKRGALYTVLVIIFVIGILGYFLAYRPYKNIMAKGQVLAASAQNLKEVVKKNNIDLLKNQMTDVAAKYTDFQTAAKQVYWASFIPYIADFKNGVDGGSYVVKAGQETVDAIYPYADLIGFKKGQTSFVEKSSEDRLQTAVLTLDKVLGKLDVISADIDEAEKRINTINPDRYPQKVGNKEVRSKIANIKEQFAGLASLFVDAKPFVKNLPKILGKDEEKTYLLLFQNDKERRATGGFLTAYAVFKIRNGKMTIVKSADIYSLDDSIADHPVAPPEILTYHKGVSKFYIRDSNLSPDLVKSIDLFNSLYQHSGDRVKYDGIITLDSKILVDMLTIFGDTEADGVVFSAHKDARCDCPQVIYTLFDMVDRPVGYVKTNRKGILGDLMYALFYKAIGFSPSKYWGTLAQTMFRNMDEKHILLYFTDEETEKAVEKLDYAGRIRDFSGDYLHVNNVNFAGAKSNLYVTETVTSKTDGRNRTVKVEYRNPYPHSDCSLERGGLCINATLRNWVRVYVPKGSKLVSFKGSIMPVKTYDDLGKTVFEGFLTVVPLGRAEIDVAYTLPDAVNTDQLMIQKQPGVEGQKYDVTMDGNRVYNAVMETDHTFKK